MKVIWYNKKNLSKIQKDSSPGLSYDPATTSDPFASLLKAAFAEVDPREIEANIQRIRGRPKDRSVVWRYVAAAAIAGICIMATCHLYLKTDLPAIATSWKSVYQTIPTEHCNVIVPPIQSTHITSTDLSGGPVTVVHVGDVITTGTYANRFTITRTYRATDVCSNSSTSTKKIRISDIPPSIICPANVVLSCASDVPAAEPGSLIASDNCGGTVTVVFVGDTTITDTCTNRFTITDTDYAIDLYSSSAVIDTISNAVDVTPPVFNSLPQSLIIEYFTREQNEAQMLDWLENFGYAEVSDNCGEVLTEHALLSEKQGYSNAYARTFQFRGIDECGNTNYVTATFAIMDTTPPVITSCPLGNVLLTCEFDIPAPDMAGVVAWDNCGVVSVTVESIMRSGVGCFYWPPTTAYTYAVTDECGNMSNYYQSFQVVDSIPPTYTGPDTIYVWCVADLPGPGDLGDVLAPYFVDNCYSIICVGEGRAQDINSVSYRMNAKDLCMNWAEKFTVTFVATGDCKPLCTAPQDIWGDTGGSINGMATTEAIGQLINKHGTIEAGKLGKTISVTSAACLQNMLPGTGYTNQFSPDHIEFSMADGPLLNSDGTLKNKLVVNVLAAQLNIWYNSDTVPILGNCTIPSKSEDIVPLNGVTTYDLVLSSKHILGWESFNSPYKMIAADANTSGSVTTFDISELRKLILGIDNKLPNNTPWRFIDKSFVLLDTLNPFSTIFLEGKTMESIQASQMAEDFVSVKIGDVNGSIQTNAFMSINDRSTDTLLFDMKMKSGQILPGYQFICLNEEEAPSMTVSITNLLGQELSRQTLSNGEEVDIAAIPNGLYLVTVTTPSGKVFSGKITKQD